MPGTPLTVGLGRGGEDTTLCHQDSGAGPPLSGPAAQLHSNGINPILSSSKELFNSEKQKEDDEDEEEIFSDDSLVESPGKRSRVSRRLRELARRIAEEDGLQQNAVVDSLVSEDSGHPVEDSLVVDSLLLDSDNLVDCQTPPLSGHTMDRETPETSARPADSLVDSLLMEGWAPEEPGCLQARLKEVNLRLRKVEGHQLQLQLRKMEKELEDLKNQPEIIVKSSWCPLSLASSPSRAKWKVTDIQIATVDLSSNPEMSFSYDNMAPLLAGPLSPLLLPSSSPFPSPPSSKIRDGYSPDSSSEEEDARATAQPTALEVTQMPAPAIITAITSSQVVTPPATPISPAILDPPPRPVQARHPPPVPNLPLLQEDRPLPLVSPSPLSPPLPGVRSLLPKHSAPLGMTSMWIPSSPSPSLSSSRSSSLATSRSSLTSCSRPSLRPRPQTGPAPPMLRARLSILPSSTVLPSKGGLPASSPAAQHVPRLTPDMFCLDVFLQYSDYFTLFSHYFVCTPFFSGRGFEHPSEGAWPCSSNP